MVYKLYDKKFSDDAVASADKSAIKTGIMSNQQLADELHKPVKRKFEKQKCIQKCVPHIMKGKFCYC